MSLFTDYFTYKFTEHFYDLTKETIDNNSYKVINSFNNKFEAAQLLHQINNNLLSVINYIDHKYNINNINNYHEFSNVEKKELLNSIKRMKKNYRPFNIQENLPNLLNKDTSYTINKGDIFALCLRFVNNKHLFHDMNTLMFVSLHELAHLFSKTYGHNHEFWKNFKFILLQAIEINMYYPINYNIHKVDYCSIKITYNPVFDKSL